MAKIYQYVQRPILSGEIYEAFVSGKFLSILTWASATDLKISVQGEEFSNIKAGMSIRLPDSADPFTYIRFQNLTGGTVTLEYAVSDGSIIDSRFTAVGTVSVTVPGKITAIGYGLQAVSNVAPGTLIAAANAARRSLIVTNLNTNLGNMYIGFDALLTNVKYVVMLLPGQSYAFDDYAGAVYALATINLDVAAVGEV